MTEEQRQWLAAASKLYAERDTEALGYHYMRHLSAMTGERLHAKSDIAAELAYRDIALATERAAHEAAERERDEARDELNASQARERMKQELLDAAIRDATEALRERDGLREKLNKLFGKWRDHANATEKAEREFIGVAGSARAEELLDCVDEIESLVSPAVAPLAGKEQKERT